MRVSILIFLILFFARVLSACNCVEAEINGEECGGCDPDGWEAISFTPDIFIDGGVLTFCQGIENSTDGGGIIHILPIEATSTELTGLTPGDTYYLGFEAAACNLFNGTDLAEALFEIADYSEVFTLDYQWEEIYICFVAESSTELLTVENVTPASSNTSVIFDYLPCSIIDPEDTSCGANIEIEYEDVELCSGEEFELEVDVIEGDKDDIDEIEWTSDPESGVDFLSETDILEPTFLWPEDEPFSRVKTFEFLVSVWVGPCEFEAELTVVVVPNVIPDFDDLAVCVDDEDFLLSLPTRSEDGYKGEWDGPDIEECEDEFKDFTFTIFEGQDNCLIEAIYPVYVSPAETPEFSFELEYCLNDSERVSLPDISDNDIDGDWDFRNFRPSSLGVGIHANTFIPDEDDFPCADELTVEIIVTDFIELEFELPDIFCFGDSFSFPDTSLNGQIGSWQIGLIDTLSITQSYVNIFTPNDQSCLEEYRHEFELAFPSIQYNIESPSNCWVEDGVIIIASEDILEYSIDGGLSWQTEGRFEGLGFGFYDIQYRLLGEVKCLNERTIQIEGEQPSLERFEVLDATSCQDSLGSISFIGGPVSGQIEYSIDYGSNWEFTNGNFFNLAPASYELWVRNDRFPDCILIQAFEISRFDFPLVEEVKSTPLSNCGSMDGSIEVFATGENIEYSIDGGSSWQATGLFESLEAGSYSILCRSNGIDDCIELVEQSLEAPPLKELSYSLIDPSSCQLNDGSICIDDSDVTEVLEYSLDGGMSWQVENKFEELAAGTYELRYRVSSSLTCEDKVSFTLESADAPILIDLLVTKDSSCVVDNGSIELDVLQDAVEYSIDGGQSWQDQSIFMNLTSTVYVVIVRLKADPGCFIELTVELGTVVLPDVEGVVDNPSSCTIGDGSIVLQNSDPSVILEYSIDGGQSWQEELDFINLGAGIYTVHYRVLEAPDCVDELEFILSNPGLPTIEELVVKEDVSCIADVGSIELVTPSTELEFSIDEGVSWQASKLFEDLGQGQYEIIIRVKSSPDCILIVQAEVLGIALPEVQIELNKPATACDQNNGQVELRAENISDDAEYSIDGGQTWLDSGFFEMLPASTYTILARDRRYPDCITENSITIDLEEEVLTGVILSLDNPSICGLEDGSILFNSTESGIEYSIDGGVSFYLDPLFENLGADSYLCVARLEASPLCFETYQVDLIDPECPCETYILNYTAMDADCLNPTGSIEVMLGSDEAILWENSLAGSSLMDLVSGWYYLTISYDMGMCEYVDSIFIDEEMPLEFGLEVFPSDCNEEANGSLTIQGVSGGDGVYEYSLDSINFQSESGFYNLSPGAYEAFVQDGKGCLAFQDFLVELASDPIDIALDNFINIKLGDTITLNPLIDASSINAFEWSSSESIIDTDNIIIQVSPEKTTTYFLKIEYGEGCIEFREITIEVTFEQSDIFIPNVIDVQDPENNVFFVQGSLNSNIVLEAIYIYDRWGNTVFEKSNPSLNNDSEGWDPSAFSEYEQGVYIYYVSYSMGDEKQLKVGSLTLMR